MDSGGQQIDCFASPPCSSSSCVKIYLCSNPEDSVVERRALRETVFPRFTEHCRHSLGLEVRVIDPFESSDPRRWPDENTRQQLIQECRESSAGPFLLALVGHQYGAASLPTQVEVSEYQLLLQESQQAGISTQELERVYQRDENTVPASYCLRPSHRHTCCSTQAEVKEEEQSITKAKDAELRKVFQAAVSLCVHSDLMTPERARSYYRSALDADLRFALDKRPDEDIMRRCLVYVHKVVNARGEREKREMSLQPKSESDSSDQVALRPPPTSDQLLSELCDVFLPGLITSSKLLVYATTTECDRRHGYTTTRRRGYAEGLCQQVYSDLVGLIDDLNISEDSNLGDALSREEAEQKQLCDIFARFYDVTRPEEEKVRAYVEQRDQQCPLVVMGGPCTGKTVLLAHCSQHKASHASHKTALPTRQRTSVCGRQRGAIRMCVCSAGISGQETACEDVGVAAERFRAEGDFRTTSSDSDVTESSLPDGVHLSISALLDHLEQTHGSTLVARAVSYLALSRTGLSEAELTDLLSSNDEVLAEDVCHREDIPQVDMERLLMKLKSFLIKRTVADSQVLYWVSRHFKLVVAKRYLGSFEVKRKIHSEIADYFSGQLACDNGKPLLVNQKSRQNKALNVNTDRQPTSQPFVFLSSKDVGRVNMRKVLELPYHLEQSGRLEELECDLLMSLGFHQAMVQAGLLGDLVAMLESDEDSSQFLRERLLLASILKSSACFLQNSPLQLLTVMETNLLPYLEVFPALECYVKEIRTERRCRGRGLGTALCPSPSSILPIQYLQCDRFNEGCVIETAATEFGIVAQIMDDGSAWILSGSGCDMVKLSLSFEQEEVKFAGVKSSGPFLLLSTQCNKLFVWDVTGPEMLVEVKAHLKKELECSQTPNKIEGFAACQKKLFLWGKDESCVSVFDISSETLTHFQCQGSVTCLALSSDGFFMYCGQDDGTVSIFDIKASNLIGTCSNSNRSAVTLIILCEDKREMACVDRNGNVSLWDVADKVQLPRLVKENFNRSESNNILSTDYSEEINTLLVCQGLKVSLWDTSNWELWDQFLAPKGRAFTQAVLSQDGHLFLALLDTCSLVLVWTVSTGECVLSLETTKQPHTLLKMASDVICVDHDGCLTVWDSEMIDVAGTALKMGCGVREVVVEETGEGFYTTDGSEKVWRWSLNTGLPRDNFLHDGPVEKLQLSSNSIYLVSLSAGEIYVWNTETGENIVRISGSRATNILITPNSKFGVSISERGLTRVWKMALGSIVCSIHLYLSDAQVSPESTYLIGRRYGDLLAASLWSGSISKRFSCVESSEHVVAFQTLTEHPDFVVVMAASGAVYTWKVAEETVCRHFQLPYTFHCHPQDFQMSSDGSYALLSTDNGTINLLDLSRVRLCSFKAEGPITKACLDQTGCYAAYVSHPSSLENSCTCSMHARPILTVTRLSDGERIGSVRLSKNPLTLVACERQCVFVGFEDGSVGAYSVSDDMIDEEEMFSSREGLNGQMKQCPFDRTPFSWFPRATPNITWP
ncbi:NACHT and WD repeat domain-containing protein 2-like isoform X4 [Amphiprion ocellaris]|uniref:NACHT and WD repeat domain-containing protein 2-like isoform X4 n=1 Tax=Amphiprion ocellaris TaxID=80972 RepID=UPI0024114860|nr:NACHT and WD repeat domain-containing protein 2-like isoform X4 [Amphiprion ocellaris]